MNEEQIPGTDVDLDALANRAIEWVQSDFLTLQSGLQFGLLLFAVLLTVAIYSRLEAWSGGLRDRYADYAIHRLFTAVQDNAFPLTWLIIQWLAIVVPRMLGWDDQILVVTTSLLTAWVFIRIVSTLISNPLVARVVATIVWIWAALTILGLIDETKAVMSDIGFGLGGVKLNLMGVFEGIVTLAFLLWLASFAAQIIENSLKNSPNLTPSIQVLSSKLVRMGLIALAFFASLGIVGIDLTALAVFSGAIGVGLGFGLQKIFGNLVSGIILLLDKSIKPGDVIAVPGYYGRVDSLGARYVSVYTRDGIEHLIPNEDLIVNRVENWTHSQNFLRLRQALGVHYKSDVHQAMALCIEAAKEIPRILKEPAPNCLMRGYGDSAVDLEVRFWIDDPMNGRANVRSELLIAIWEKFHEHNIEIPYPQRDLHIRSSVLDNRDEDEEEDKGEPLGGKD
tara:strand:- start:17553 stop:18905 length:1353 start_codon:yes stop_codon:yes gene_type:complete